MVLTNPPAPRFIFDTDVLVHYLRGKKAGLAIEQEFHFQKTGFRPIVSVVTVGELLAFSRNLKWGENKRGALERLRQQMYILDISRTEILETYAELSSNAKNRGWSIFHKKNDLWIAATAVASGLSLITCDKKDFKNFSDRINLVILDADTGKITQ
ncbi:MAG: PIN domain-containing protein [Verrucomicrobia bacterium]|nr:PIN domain-containing protein [Verrucomicrobiota bacterium]MDA1065445.1 PIN domain-containing protein [Verrucomicrobiota bacterium]